MRAYRALLWLYPASFRKEFGGEMASIFAARRRATSGTLAVLSLWLGAMIDIVPNAVAVHWDILRQDLRFVARSLRKSPGFTLTAVLVTTLGVGANVASFAVTDFALLRPLPYPEPDRLVQLWETAPGYDQLELSPANYRDWREGTQSFESMGAYIGLSGNLIGGETPERVEYTLMEKSVFETLRVEPMLGRRFAEDDVAGAAHTVMLSHSFWQTHFGSDPGILGRTITLNDRVFQVIGVMGPDFRFPSSRTRLWVGMSFTERNFENRSDHSYLVVARLLPGATAERAEAELQLLAKRMAESHPETNRQGGAVIGSLRDGFSDRNRTLLWSLSGASLCILLIACANLGNLLLARGIARRQELAVRTALGAGRERLVRQMVTEGLVIAGMGGLLGIVTAVAALPLLSQLIPTDVTHGGTPTIDLRVLAFAAVVTGVTTLAFAVLPALRGGGAIDLTELQAGSRAGGGRREAFRSVLVTVEVAASVVLLVGSGLLMRAIAKVHDVDPGFRSDEVYTVRTALPAPRYSKVADRERFYREVQSQVEALPGVTEASYVSCLPMVCGGMIWPVTISGTGEGFDQNNTASLRYLTPGYFSTMGIPLLDGRDVSEQDHQTSPPVAVVSKSFADRYWPGEHSLGRRFQMAMMEREVVGVVGDIKARGLERRAEPQVYIPASQIRDSLLSFYWPKDLAVRTSESPATLLPALKRIVRATDPAQPISDAQPLSAIVADQTASRKVQLKVLGVLAAVALLLAAVGIHGLLSFMVSQQSREIGVRMALGASGAVVVRSVLRRGLSMALAGIAIGGVVAYFAGRAIRAALFGVPAADPVTFGVVLGLCLMMTLVGCLAPAIRAVRIDPLRAMRAE
ncbi:MAG: ABC transporter permease [Gemmatimonadales bacterium]